MSGLGGAGEQQADSLTLDLREPPQFSSTDLQDGTGVVLQDREEREHGWATGTPEKRPNADLATAQAAIRLRVTSIQADILRNLLVQLPPFSQTQHLSKPMGETPVKTRSARNAQKQPMEGEASY